MMNFRDANSAATFLSSIELIVDFDMTKIKDRRTYIAALKQRALSGA